MLRGCRSLIWRRGVESAARECAFQMRVGHRQHRCGVEWPFGRRGGGTGDPVPADGGEDEQLSGWLDMESLGKPPPGGRRGTGVGLAGSGAPYRCVRGPPHGFTGHAGRRFHGLHSCGEGRGPPESRHCRKMAMTSMACRWRNAPRPTRRNAEGPTRTRVGPHDRGPLPRLIGAQDNRVTSAEHAETDLLHRAAAARPLHDAWRVASGPDPPVEFACMYSKGGPPSVPNLCLSIVGRTTPD